MGKLLAGLGIVLFAILNFSIVIAIASHELKREAFCETKNMIYDSRSNLCVVGVRPY